MNRIAYMVMKHLFRVPMWLLHIDRMGKHKDQYPEQERYNYIRKMVKIINIGGRVQVDGFGTENLPKEEGFVLFPNHQGLFDMLAIIDTCPHPMGVVIKKEAENWFLVKQVMSSLDGISMDRSDIRSSLKVINQVTDLIKKKRNFLIFPEGTRSREENNILEFKAGTFKSAVHAKCPIVPVALIDCFKPFDISSIKKERVQVHYLNPIYPDQYLGLKTKEIADIVHDRIQDKINENMI